MDIFRERRMIAGFYKSRINLQNNIKKNAGGWNSLTFTFAFLLMCFLTVSTEHDINQISIKMIEE